ncbi:MAG: hemerythrin-like domain-containing protein [Parasphingorhabdus sp.]
MDSLNIYSSVNNMTDLIEQVRYDHISMSRILLLVEHELTKLGAGRNTDFDLVLESMQYMIEYSEAIHHPKEDAIMSCIYGRKHELDKFIDAIREQHERMDTKSTNFYRLIQLASMDQFVKRQNIIDCGNNYILLQRNHMRLEEEKLLGEIKLMLTVEDSVRINKQFIDQKDPQIKDDFEKSFNGLYRSLIGL